jgi:hypothetical protein
MNHSPAVAGGDRIWQQHERLTVSRAREVSLRELQEHIYWVGVDRNHQVAWTNAEPNFPWWPHRMGRDALIDAVGTWANVFDPAGGHAPPLAHVAAARNTLLKLDAAEFFIHLRGATVEELERGERAAAAIFVEAKVNPYDAADAMTKRDAWDKGGDDLTEAECRMTDVWERAQAAATAACCDGWSEQPREEADFHIVDNDDAMVEFLLSVGKVSA